MDRRRPVIVHVPDEESARLEWGHTKRIELSLDDVPVEEQFKLLVSEGGIQSS